MAGRIVVLVFAFLTSMCAAAGPATSALPGGGPHTRAYRDAILALRERLRSTPPPPISEKEQSDAIDWMQRANPEIKHTLVGHHVIVMATDGFAARAQRSEFLLNVDLGYEVLVHMWGTDPVARVGRRFVIWPDPGRDRGHNCNGRDLRIAVGRRDWDNAEWFERYFHEMTHGFQFEHPAGYLMMNGFFEGWAEFMQAAVCDHLSPLGAPFAGRFEWYSTHFPESGRVEFVQTNLPIEEVVQYDPSAGLLMELVNTTKDGAGHPDWTRVRRLLQDPFGAPRWTPWHLWPAMMACDCMTVFGKDNARPILSKYRFPLDLASMETARAQNSGVAKPNPSPRVPFAGERGWVCIGPIANPKRMGMEWDALCAEDIAWRWRGGTKSEAPPLDASRAEHWRAIGADTNGIIQLDGPTGGAAYFYLATTLPAPLRGPLTLYVASDDECAVWLDGQLVHMFRGIRSCTPDFPDVAYADATDGPGQILVLVVNHDGPAAFSLAVSKGGLLFDGFRERIASKDPVERAAAAKYLRSRRMQQPVARMLEGAMRDKAITARDAASGCPDLSPADGGDYREAEEAYARGTIAGGFFGNNAGASGNQCVARSWGDTSTNWLSLPLKVKRSGVQQVRIRYACPREPPREPTLRVRVRQGDRVLFTIDVQHMRPTGKDWTAWAWHDVVTPPIERGVYHVELVEPANGADVDMIGIVAR